MVDVTGFNKKREAESPGVGYFMQMKRKNSRVMDNYTKSGDDIIFRSITQQIASVRRPCPEDLQQITVCFAACYRHRSLCLSVGFSSAVTFVLIEVNPALLSLTFVICYFLFGSFVHSFY